MDKIFLVFCLIGSTVIGTQQAYAWFFNFGWGDHQPRYRHVVVGDSTYYYNGGVFYTGSPGNYVVVEAPDGAVIYDTPPDYQTVVIDGDEYFLSHGVYYRREGRGFRVMHPGRGHHEFQDRREREHGGDMDREHREDRDRDRHDDRQ